uniref:Uncharacterized protein n=1 Tax=Oryza sativa subsp. japonica TaxID=39947 RepID=Q6Z657_ORYSJ|nr:hypothetical protein [Oryza sativa Japonica Group]
MRLGQREEVWIEREEVEDLCSSGLQGCSRHELELSKVSVSVAIHRELQQPAYSR